MGITYPSKAIEYIKRLTDTKVPVIATTKKSHSESRAEKCGNKTTV